MTNTSSDAAPVRESATNALSGRIAVITGASGAIGGAACRTLARRRKGAVIFIRNWPTSDAPPEKLP